ncbi:unnamed protein product [marine sediment metagenome]|uniref:Uncharacterized protein n=1 Tax=marine sediment metagenome TaxID=412755 RepID=X1TWD4_9ZZZZ
MKAIKDITYRDIAIMLVKAMPVEGQEFSDKVNEYLETIKALPTTAKLALRSAYIFGSKAPREEREDLFQDIALAILESQVEDERLAYAIARCDWKDWWKRYKIRQHYSLDSVTENEDGDPVTLGELIVGETEFERKMNGKLDAERIWQKLPDYIKPIIQNRMLGYALNQNDRQALSRWTRQEGYRLLLA